MGISKKIRKLRLDKKLTQKNLATLIDKSTITVRKYESGEITPPHNVLKDIASALDVRLYDLLPDEEQRNTEISNTIEKIISQHPHHKIQILDLRAMMDQLIWDEFSKPSSLETTNLMRKAIDNNLNLYNELFQAIRYFSNLQFLFDSDNAVKEKNLFSLYKKKDKQIIKINAILNDIYQNSLKKYGLGGKEGD